MYHMQVRAHEGQKWRPEESIGSLELEFQSVVNCPLGC